MRLNSSKRSAAKHKASAEHDAKEKDALLLASLRSLPSPYGLETATLALLKLSLKTTKQSESPFSINKED